MHEFSLQLLNGLVVGSSLALVASGLALIFGVLDIINFAQGDFFMLGGYALWVSLQHTHNFLLSVIIAGLVVGVGGGLLLLLLTWPLLDRAHALTLLATLGLSLILQQEATNVFGGATKLIPTPISKQVVMGSVHYPVYNFIIVAVSAAILLAGYLFLRYAKYGIWVRAVAQNRLMAAAMGVPVPRVYIVAFMASAALAGIAGAMLAPVVSVYPAVGNDIILNAFIIVVAGGMGNLGGAAAVAVLLGEVQSLGAIKVRPTTVQLIALGLVIVLLIVRSRRQSVPSQPAAAPSAAATPSRGRQRLLWYGLGAIVVAALAFYPPLAGGFKPQQFTIYFIFGLLAFSVALIVAHARLFNIGIGATFGVSAYAVAILTQHGVINPVSLLVVAIAAGLVVSVLFGIYAIVASGIEYMMLTFLTTLAMFKVPNLAVKLTGGDNGLIVRGGLKVSFGLNPLFGHSFYLFVLTVVVVCTLLCWYILQSPAGKAVRAIGRNPVRAAAMGYQLSQYRMALTLLSGFVAATAGWLYALNSSFVAQNLLGLDNSLNGLVYALVGGAQALLGPFVGAAGFRYVTETLSQRSTQSGLYIGLVVLLIVYFMPNGVIGLLQFLAGRTRVLPLLLSGRPVPAQAETEDLAPTTTVEDSRAF